MPDLNLKDIKEVKKGLVEISKRGFLYFLKNIFLIAAGGIFLYLLLNLDWTVQFAQEHTERFIFGIMILFVAVFEIVRSETYAAERKKNNKEFFDDFNKVQQIKEEEVIKKHDELVKKRFAIGPLISNILKDIIISLGASRASVIEMHNGTNSLSGIPFIYGDMMYEETDKDVSFTIDEYKDFNMSKFPFITKFFYEGSWFGPVEEMKDIDKMLYLKMTCNDTKYFGFMTINGLNSPVGFLTVSFKDDDIPPKERIYTDLAIATQKISALLDDLKIE